MNDHLSPESVSLDQRSLVRKAWRHFETHPSHVWETATAANGNDDVDNNVNDNDYVNNDNDNDDVNNDDDNDDNVEHRTRVMDGWLIAFYFEKSFLSICFKAANLKSNYFERLLVG